MKNLNSEIFDNQPDALPPRPKIGDNVTVSVRELSPVTGQVDLEYDLVVKRWNGTLGELRDEYGNKFIISNLRPDPWGKKRVNAPLWQITGV